MVAHHEQRKLQVPATRLDGPCRVVSWLPEHGLDEVDEIVRSIGGWQLAARLPAVLAPDVQRRAFYEPEDRCYPVVYLLASALGSATEFE
ncbi:MAG: hypothetical protein H6834_11365 [Planctomycetes bacterium]|nr:hypothetical protein [Planctomycetota bacterium]